MGRVIEGEARGGIDGHRAGLGGGVGLLARVELERLELLLPLTHDCEFGWYFGSTKQGSAGEAEGLHARKPSSSARQLYVGGVFFPTHEPRSQEGAG